MWSLTTRDGIFDKAKNQCVVQGHKGNIRRGVEYDIVFVAAPSLESSQEYNEDGGNGGNNIRPYHDSLRPNLGLTQILGSAARGSDSSNLGGAETSGKITPNEMSHARLVTRRNRWATVLLLLQNKAVMH